MIAEHMTAGSALPVRLESAAAAGSRLEAGGLALARYALVLVLVWIGLMKFTAYEAAAIQPLVGHSPLIAWLYAVFSVRGRRAGRVRVGHRRGAADAALPCAPARRDHSANRPHSGWTTSGA